mgnify:CR=1 FL=1
MVEVLIGDNEIILISKQELPQDVYEEMGRTTLTDEGDQRINAVLQDLHASYDVNGRVMEFSRRYTEQDINPNGLKSAIHVLEKDHKQFLDFLKDLMKEINEKEKNEKNETKVNDEAKREFSIEIKNGKTHVQGNMHPIHVLAIVIELLDKFKNDETE